ncbi:MAG: cysteine desulfurase [Firmicutes bacterium]|nr:cysteine desulfurase [Bacillota bacterium]
MIYLDHNATTPTDPQVLEAMLPWFTERYGNASSGHGLGHLAEGALVAAREQVAALLHCQPAEVVFNSGGTEGLNHAFRGVFEAFPTKRHFVTTAVEHSAVQALVAWLRRQGAEVTVLGVDGNGALDLEALRAALRPDTALVSVMAANNESGVRFPLEAVAEIVKAHGALLHTDATQAVGKIPLDLSKLAVDLLNLSAHKFYGPKGAGALFIRRGLRLKPFLVGGHQERGRRGGTENVHGVVGLGRAAQLAQEALPRMANVEALRDRLEAAFPEAVIHGRTSPRLPNTSFMAFPGVEAEALLLRLDQQGICVSTGSACTTGQTEPSHVLRAMGIDPRLALSTLRFSLGRGTPAEEIEDVVQRLPSLVAELTRNGPPSL